MRTGRFSSRSNLVGRLACVALSVSACSTGEPGNDEQVEQIAEGKTAFALTDSVGAYGRLLQQQGWKLRNPRSIDDVPQSSQTIVYMNADEAVGSAMSTLLAQFKGVLVVDSEYLYPAAREDGSMKDEAPSPGGDEAARAADTYLELVSEVPGKMATMAPGGTAIIASMSRAKLFSLEFSEDGTVNGLPTREVDDIVNLSRVAAENIEMRTRADDGWGSWNSDAVVEFSTVKNGYRAGGQVFVNAFQSGNNSWFTETYVWTGNKESVCLTNGSNRCGIYPSSNKTIFQSTRRQNGVVDTVGWVTKHAAWVSGYGATGIPAFRPGAAMWNATEKRDTDSYEVSYTTTFSIGASAKWSNFTDFDLPINAGFSRSSVHRKTMHSWDGWDSPGLWSYYRGNDASGKKLYGPIRSVSSGVVIKPEKNKIYSGFVGGAWSNADAFGQMLGQNTLSNNRDFCQAINQTISKPKMSWEGWQPSVVAVHRFDKNFYSYTSNKNRILIRAGLTWERQPFSYNFSPKPPWNGNVQCGQSNYRRDIWMLNGRPRKIELIAPPDMPWVQFTHVDIYVKHRFFTN
jgi:hypothetical protein